MVKCIPATPSSSSEDTPILYTREGPSQAEIVQWYLAELKLTEAGHKAVQQVMVDTAGVLPINPFGTFPALAHGELKLFEAGAILLYLGRLYDALFKSGSQACQAVAIQWVEFAGSTLCLEIHTSEDKLRKTLEVLDSILEKATETSLLGGAELSVADVAVASYLIYLPDYKSGFSFSEWPALEEYVARMMARFKTSKRE